MHDFLMLLFVLSFLGYFVWLLLRMERWIEDVLRYKAKDNRKSWVSRSMGAFLLLLHIAEMSTLKNTYLERHDFDFLVEYKQIIALWVILIVWLISLVVIEMTTSY